MVQRLNWSVMWQPFRSFWNNPHCCALLNKLDLHDIFDVSCYWKSRYQVNLVACKWRSRNRSCFFRWGDLWASILEYEKTLYWLFLWVTPIFTYCCHHCISYIFNRLRADKWTLFLCWGWLSDALCYQSSLCIKRS